MHIFITVHLAFPCYSFNTFRCFVMSTKKINLLQYIIWQFLHRFSEREKSLQCGTPTEPAHISMIYYISVFSRDVKQELLKLPIERALERIDLIAFTTGFITWSNLSCFVQTACWWIRQWSLMAVPLSSDFVADQCGQSTLFNNHVRHTISNPPPNFTPW